MASVSSRGLGLLTRATLAFLCFTLPACIEDVVVMPPGDQPDPPDADAGIEGPPNGEEAIYYDVTSFAEVIQPLLDEAGCGNFGCHGAGEHAAQFVLVTSPALGSTEMWSNLQYVASRIQLGTTPFVAEDTMFYQKATGDHHTPISNPEELRVWMNEAALEFPERFAAFDPDVFWAEVQPGLDSADCSHPLCHSYPSETQFSIFPEPPAVSGKTAMNLQAVVAWIDLGAPRPEDTAFYIRAVLDNHGETTLDATQAQALAAWIQAAMDAVFESPQ